MTERRRATERSRVCALSLLLHEKLYAQAHNLDRPHGEISQGPTTTMDLNRISTTLCTVKKHTETQFLFLFEIGTLTTCPSSIKQTKHPKTKTREKKGTRWKDPRLCKQRNLPRSRTPREQEQIKYSNPLIVRRILNNERGISRTLKNHKNKGYKKYLNLTFKQGTK